MELSQLRLFQFPRRVHVSHLVSFQFSRRTQQSDTTFIHLRPAMSC